MTTSQRQRPPYMASLIVDTGDPTTVIVPGFVDHNGTEHPPVLVSGIHLLQDCHAPNCIVHRPSAHPMRDWPLAWYADLGIVVRLCLHMVMHPDPDGWGPLRHLCDGCCDLNYRRRVTARPTIQSD